jgi:hypothetical protein
MPVAAKFHLCSSERDLKHEMTWAVGGGKGRNSICFFRSIIGFF